MLCWLGFERGGESQRDARSDSSSLKKNATWHYKICPSHFSLLLSGGAAHRFSASLLSPVGKADFDFSPLSFRPPPQKKGEGEGKRGGLESSQWQKGGEEEEARIHPPNGRTNRRGRGKGVYLPPPLSFSFSLGGGGRRGEERQCSGTQRHHTVPLGGGGGRREEEEKGGTYRGKRRGGRQPFLPPPLCQHRSHCPTPPPHSLPEQ